MRLVVVFVILASMVLAEAPAVAAFSGTNAVTYAESHWKECDPVSPYNGTPPSPYVCLANDCANYASQALRAGGYPFRSNGYYQLTGLLDSWYWNSSTSRTITWYQADQLLKFLTKAEIYFRNPGGRVVANTKGASPTQRYNVLSKGDLIFFDWEDDYVFDHVRVETGWGVPPKTGWQSAYNWSYWTEGDWGDQHNPVRYHDFWNGYQHLTAAGAAAVRIYQVHIDPANS